MSERYDDALKAALVRALAEARDMQAREVTSSHLLLGALGDPGMAAVFEELGLDIDVVRLEVRGLGVGKEESPPRLTYTPRADQVLERALQEALSFEHNWVGPAHLVLALAWVKVGTFASVLFKPDRGEDRIRDAVIAHLATR